MPFVPSSFLLLVVRPRALSSILAPNSNAPTFNCSNCFILEFAGLGDALAGETRGVPQWKPCNMRARGWESPFLAFLHISVKISRDVHIGKLVAAIASRVEATAIRFLLLFDSFNTLNNWMKWLLCNSKFSR